MPQIQRKTHRACEALSTAAAAYPEAWKKAELFRSINGQPGKPHWQDWCYLPLGGWYAIVARAKHGGKEIHNLASLLDVSRLAALGAWRMTQGIYRFQPGLLASLQQAPASLEVSCAALFTLPEWGVYIETPELDQGLHGVWAHLEHDINNGALELRLLLDEDTGLTPLVVDLGVPTLAAAVQGAIEESERESQANQAGMDEADATRGVEQTARVLPVVASLLLHLCSADAVFLRKGEPARPANPVPRKTKQGARLFPAAGPTDWEVGARG
ncbi:hypothetical protein [Kerstersia gyiorum]|jgi:hypothetical protein|uniref:hypothetical protein n=1 Tax=Kerstersia gyiorum TaxID=206506 RepID=UPI00242E97C5|nr:hypothetical protein [Kerstersia gyiorum]MCH4272006.1 hypothetical protein [Kerstersia gyiorum]MCI1228993.1 hypothetical protein [Kerstersia gyiorum]